jgi:hypothetical protein
MAFCRPALPCGPPIGQIVSKLRSKPHSNVPASYYVRKGELFMAYRIVAERENETVRMDRMSSLMALAKARVWASEGWDVTIIVRDEDELASAQANRLLLV